MFTPIKLINNGVYGGNVQNLFLCVE
jgi:hypothetical protein